MRKISILASLGMLLGSLSAAQADTHEGSLDVAGVTRTWQLHVPATYSASRQHALVLDFHGTGGSPENQGKSSAFAQLAAEKGFLVANPAGKYVRAAGSGASWNVDLDPKGVDDVRFIRELIAHLQKRYSIDAARIYSTGFSGGARMSSRLACDLSDVIAAIGPVGGIRFPDKCAPTHPVAIMAIHAEDDEVNHFVHRPDSPAYWPVGVMPAVTSWAKYNGCAATPSERRISPTAIELSYDRCKPGSDLVFVRVANGGHTWPGSPVPRQRVVSDYPATQQLWAFFEKHPRK